MALTPEQTAAFTQVLRSRGRRNTHYDISRAANIIAKQAAEIERLREALKALVKLNDEDYSPFGGELLRDRIDRAWDNARAALNGGGE